MPKKRTSIESTEEIHETQERKNEYVYLAVDTTIHDLLFRGNGEISLRPIGKLSTRHARSGTMFVVGYIGLLR